MVRVLLFVQTGDGRPKCSKQFGTDMGRALTYCNRLTAADRWWLVECEDAEAGRRAIGVSLDRYYNPDGSPSKYGRILAQGGRAE